MWQWKTNILYGSCLEITLFKRKHVVLYVRLRFTFHIQVEAQQGTYKLGSVSNCCLESRDLSIFKMYY